MPVQSSWRTARLVALPLVVAVGFLISGCRKADQIEERTEPIPLSETPYIEADGDAKVAVLVGMAPLGRERDRWCFFKMVGPADAVARERSRFDEFIGSLDYQPKLDIPFFWQVPNEWRWLPGTGFRLATIKTGPLRSEVLLDLVDDPAIRIALRAFYVGYEARFAELSVSKAGGSMLANVNRWRNNDLGLPPISAADLPRLLRYRNLETATIIIVEMAGPGGQKKAMPAFHPPVEQ